MRRSVNNPPKNQVDYTESALNALLVEVELLESKAADLKDVYSRHENESSKLKYFASEKEFELKKVQTKRKYLDVSIGLGKKELQLKSNELNEKRYSTQIVLDLLVHIKCIGANCDTSKVSEELCLSCDDLRNVIERSEEAREISRIYNENLKLERRRDSLRSEVEQLRSRLKHVKHEVSKQEQNSIFDWIAEMSALAIEERRLHNMLKERTEENRLIERSYPSPPSLNSTNLTFPSSKLSLPRNNNPKSDRIPPAASNNTSIISSRRSSKSGKESKAPTIVLNEKRTPKKHVNNISKLLNDPFDVSQCSLISSQSPGSYRANKANNAMEFEQVTPPPRILVPPPRGGQNGALRCNSPDRRVLEGANNVALGLDDNALDKLLNTTYESLSKRDTMSINGPGLGITDLFEAHGEGGDFGQNLSEVEDNARGEESNLLGTGEDFMMDFDERNSADNSKRVLFNERVRVNEITPHKVANEKTSEIENDNIHFDMNDFNAGGYATPENDDVFGIMDPNGANVTLMDNGAPVDDGDLNFNFNMFDDSPNEKERESRDGRLLDIAMEESNDNIADIDEFRDLMDFGNFFN